MWGSPERRHRRTRLASFLAVWMLESWSLQLQLQRASELGLEPFGAEHGEKAPLPRSGEGNPAARAFGKSLAMRNKAEKEARARARTPWLRACELRLCLAALTCLQDFWPKRPKLQSQERALKRTAWPRPLRALGFLGWAFPSREPKGVIVELGSFTARLGVSPGSFPAGCKSGTPFEETAS